MNKIDIVAITVLFIIAFSLWTLPLQNDPRPFGEGDSAWHFSIGDYIASSDKPIFRLPFYIGQWYYLFNPSLGVNAPEYPPPNHYNYALMQISGGDRFVPIIMYRAIASFLGIFAVYFLISKLFGTAAAIIASSGLVFSVREQMIYLWGQQPTLISVVIAPITLYAFYRYLDSYYKNEKKISYLYVTALLLASQYLLHIQGFALSILVLGSFTGLMFIKHRKLPLIKESKKSLATIAAIFLVLSLPFAMIYLGTVTTTVTPDYSRIFSWGVDHSLVSGSYPPAFTNFSGTYPVILLPLLFLGIVFALLRRTNKDLLILGWLLGIYLVLHTDLYVGTGPERAARMLIAEPALFYSLIAIGAMGLLSFKFPAQLKTMAKYVVAAIVVVIILQSTASITKDTFEGSYQGIFRITPAQSEVSDWMRVNLPEDALIYYVPIGPDFKIGTWQYPKLRWMLATSQRHVAYYTGTFVNNTEVVNSPTYFIFDYTDIGAILNSAPNPLQPSAQQSLNSLQQFEITNFNISHSLYNQNNIRVYEVEAEDFQ